jgi:rhodanese-related sulfurtransferase
MPSLSSQFNTMSITSDSLYAQVLNNSSTVLLLDCRPYNEYSQSHVHNAINLAVPSLMLRRLKKGCSVNFANMINTEEGKRRFAKRDLMDKIVIYDASTDSLTNTALELIIQRLAAEGLTNIFYLKGNFYMSLYCLRIFP